MLDSKEALNLYLLAEDSFLPSSASFYRACPDESLPKYEREKEERCRRRRRTSWLRAGTRTEAVSQRAIGPHIKYTENL